MLDKIPPYVLVAVGGMFGALARYWISGLFKTNDFPFGTLIVNVLGSGILGFLVTIYSMNILDSNWLLLLGTGMMGSLTTMSTFAVETIRIGENETSYGVYNLIGTIVLVFISVYIGQAIAIFIMRRGGVIA